MRPWIGIGTGAIVYALVTFWAARRIPEDGVPTHFTEAGVADRFGSATEVVAVWAGLGLGMIVLAIAAVLLVRHGPLGIVNVPDKGYWTAPGRVRTLRRMLADDISLVMGATIIFVALVPVWMVLAARSPDGSVTPLTIWLPAALYLVGVASWTCWLVRGRYRPRDA